MLCNLNSLSLSQSWFLHQKKKNIIFIVVVQNGLSFEITLSNYLLMVYRNIIDFNVLIL